MLWQAYVADVRQQVLESGVLERCGSERAAMRSCVLSIEHQRMHLETLAYMLAQKVCCSCHACRSGWGMLLRRELA